MIVCVCEGISDHEIRDQCRRGAANVSAMARACGAGDKCGSCRKQIKSLITETRATARPPTSSRPSAVWPLLIVGG